MRPKPSVSPVAGGATFRMQRSIVLNGTLRPRAEGMLRAIPTGLLHHDQHGLRHPLSAYQASLDQISVAWLEALKLFDHLRIEVMLDQPRRELPLLQAYRTLLYRLNEHIDTTHAVLRSLRPPVMGKPPRFHSEFLDRTNLPGWAPYKASVHELYRTPRLGLLVNEMKHAGGELRGLYGTSDESVFLGYYLEGGRENSAVGPNLRLHRKWGRLETAFSFAFDMLLNMIWLYRSSELASACIEQTLLLDASEAITEKPPAQPDLSGWANLCHQLSQLNLEFYPDEFQKARPIIVCSEDLSRLDVKFAPPRRVPIGPFRLQGSLTPNEGTQSFILPYMQDQSGVP